jgi:hypothetical protein
MLFVGSTLGVRGTLLAATSALILLLLTWVVLVALLTSLHVLFMCSTTIIFIRHVVLLFCYPHGWSTDEATDGSLIFYFAMANISNWQKREQIRFLISSTVSPKSSTSLGNHLMQREVFQEQKKALVPRLRCLPIKLISRLTARVLKTCINPDRCASSYCEKLRLYCNISQCPAIVQ